MSDKLPATPDESKAGEPLAASGLLDILAAYNTLAEIARKTPEKPAHGIGGMWTPDEQHESDVLIWRAYAAGYEHQLISPRFGFEIVEGYTNAEGTTARLTRGTPADVEKCLAHFGMSNVAGQPTRPQT